MQVYRISKCKFIDDLTGTGAALYSGRWHNIGTYIIYTSQSQTLALLENIANNALMAYIRYCCLTLELPENNIEEIKLNALPKNWLRYPHPKSLKTIGDTFFKQKKSLALKVPSAIMNGQWNYLINPLHKDFKKIKIIKKEEISFDRRLLRTVYD